jgi:hypothetical protein
MSSRISLLGSLVGQGRPDQPAQAVAQEPVAVVPVTPEQLGISVRLAPQGRLALEELEVQALRVIRGLQATAEALQAQLALPGLVELLADQRDPRALAVVWGLQDRLGWLATLAPRDRQALRARVARMVGLDKPAPQAGLVPRGLLAPLVPRDLPDRLDLQDSLLQDPLVRQAYREAQDHPARWDPRDLPAPPV